MWARLPSLGFGRRSWKEVSHSPRVGSRGSVGFSNWNEILSCFSQSHAWAIFGSIFPICFSFPQHRMWEVRITQHSLLIPKMPLNSFPWIFVPIHAELFEWLPAHTKLFHTSEPLPMLFSLPRLPFQHSFLLKNFYSSPKTLPQTLPQRCLLLIGYFIKEIVYVCLHHENIRYQGSRVRSEMSLFSSCLAQKKCSKTIGLKN